MPELTETDDGQSDIPGDGLSTLIRRLATFCETAIYLFAFLLLGAAAVLVVIGSVEAVVDVAAGKQDVVQGAVLVLDRVLLALIVAELAYTLRTVTESHQIAAEPFLFVGLIAGVRRILIVTAAFEEPQTDAALTRLLLELGALALLVLSIAAAIFLIRYSGQKSGAAIDDKPTRAA